VRPALLPRRRNADSRDPSALLPWTWRPGRHPALLGELHALQQQFLPVGWPQSRGGQFLRRARRLIVLAMHPELSFAAMARAGPGPLLPPEVARLCQDLVRIFEGKAPSGAPVCQLTNPWGAFTFRPYWLDRGAEPGASALIGITVERLESLALAPCRGAAADRPRARGLPAAGAWTVARRNRRAVRGQREHGDRPLPQSLWEARRAQPRGADPVPKRAALNTDQKQSKA
jgi:hypothetical protein